MIDPIQTAMATRAARLLPARLDVAGTAKLLGFAEHDIQILMSVGKLTPLGDPAPNAPKWFAAIEMVQLAADRDWLHKATKELSKYWKHKRERRMDVRGRGHTRFFGEKVSPESSPEPSLNGRCRGVGEAASSNHRAIEKSA